MEIGSSQEASATVVTPTEVRGAVEYLPPYGVVRPRDSLLQDSPKPPSEAIPSAPLLCTSDAHTYIGKHTHCRDRMQASLPLHLQQSPPHLPPHMPLPGAHTAGRR